MLIYMESRMTVELSHKTLAPRHECPIYFDRYKYKNTAPPIVIYHASDCI